MIGCQTTQILPLEILHFNSCYMENRKQYYVYAII